MKELLKNKEEVLLKISKCDKEIGKRSHFSKSITSDYYKTLRNTLISTLEIINFKIKNYQ